MRLPYLLLVNYFERQVKSFLLHSGHCSLCSGCSVCRTGPPAGNCLVAADSSLLSWKDAQKKQGKEKDRRWIPRNIEYKDSGFAFQQYCSILKMNSKTNKTFPVHMAYGILEHSRNSTQNHRDLPGSRTPCMGRNKPHGRLWRR